MSHNEKMQQTINDPTSLVWQRSKNPIEIVDLLEYVELNSVERLAVLRCFECTDMYQVYVVKLEFVVAFCIATFLPQTGVLHIKYFALHPFIRGQKLASGLWKSWNNYVIQEQKWNVSNDSPLSIEVDPNNIGSYEKLTGATVLKDSKLFGNDNPIMWMGKNLQSTDLHVIQSEWFHIQQKHELIIKPSRSTPNNTMQQINKLHAMLWIKHNGKNMKYNSDRSVLVFVAGELYPWYQAGCDSGTFHNNRNYVAYLQDTSSGCTFKNI